MADFFPIGDRKSARSRRSVATWGFQSDLRPSHRRYRVTETPSAVSRGLNGTRKGEGKNLTWRTADSRPCTSARAVLGPPIVRHDSATASGIPAAIPSPVEKIQRHFP